MSNDRAALTERPPERLSRAEKRERGFRRLSAIVAAPAILAVALAGPLAAADRYLDTLEKLGAALFVDRSLSVTRTQACVSCHSPQLAFTDPRELGELRGATSRGAHLTSFGDRNSPTLAYAALTPPFQLDAERQPLGGLFHDGRARGLDEQAGQPVLDATEMAMPNKAAVLVRLREKPEYVEAFPKLFTPDVLDDEQLAFSAMSKALAAFEHTPDFMAFDSRYDRALHGGAALSPIEAKGEAIFFSPENGGCSSCHSLTGRAAASREAFTNYRYVNLGVPANAVARRLNGSRAGRIDHGLMANPAAAERAHDGKFKVPTLRNAAVTSPYMHNGIFQELRTAIAFHIRIADPARRALNPETGLAWDRPEVPEAVATARLSAMPRLRDDDIDALIAFLGALTDKRYERLLEK